MKHSLLHSRIAVRRALGTLARQAGAMTPHGPDDRVSFESFDLRGLHAAGCRRKVRFASHSGDAMVHLLAEDAVQASDLATALHAFGVFGATSLSVSSDRMTRRHNCESELTKRLAAKSPDETVKGRPECREGPKPDPTVILPRQTSGVFSCGADLLHSQKTGRHKTSRCGAGFKAARRRLHQRARDMTRPSTKGMP